jgi:hypothetical protein
MQQYPDIGFTPQYQDLFAGTAFGGKPGHFEAAGIDYRFYKRPIEGTPYCDITSVYGYGGPVAMGTANWPQFHHAFHEYCQADGIIAEFARLHPFIEALHNSMYARYERDVVYVDLSQSEEQIWCGFDKGCKSAIKKAVRQGVTLVQTNFVTGPFLNLYCKAMMRKDAPAYAFDDMFFTKLGDIGECVTALGADAAAVFITYGDYCHYFLSVNDGNSGATNLIVWEAIKRAKIKGCKIFNLGGGLAAGDSLESFKRSFSSMVKPFYTFRRVHNQAMYDELCKQKGVDSRDESYFPAYRKSGLGQD